MLTTAAFHNDLIWLTLVMKTWPFTQRLFPPWRLGTDSNKITGMCVFGCVGGGGGAETSFTCS